LEEKYDPLICTDEYFVGKLTQAFLFYYFY